MDINVNLLQPEKIKIDTLIVGIFEDFEHYKPADVPTIYENQIAILRDKNTKDFKGKTNELISLYSPEAPFSKLPYRLILAGLGKPGDYSTEGLRNVFGAVGNLCYNGNLDSIGISLPIKKATRRNRKEDLFFSTSAVMEGLFLGAYRFNRYKSNDVNNEFSFKKIIIYSRTSTENPYIRKGAHFAKASAEITTIARDLSNTPSNDLTPVVLANQSRKIAKKYGLNIKILSDKALEQSQLNGILAVGKGSMNTPYLIILEYKPKTGRKDIKSSKPMVFIGKAVTFDSGGISLKPGAKMDLMKHDMSGGAAVIACMAGLAELKLPVHAVGLIPAVENLPSGSATKPGDVIRSSIGKSIEILNTDAEGRLILADALAYAERYKPSFVIDVATLTGACVVALGSHAAGLMGNDEKLMDAITRVSEETGEKVWKLPLWDPYRKEMKGDTGDIKNVSGREGGAITAAAFLLEFAEKYKWAHLDIAGMAWTEKSGTYLPKGATGFGSRLLLNLAKGVGEKKIKI